MTDGDVVRVLVDEISHVFASHLTLRTDEWSFFLAGQSRESLKHIKSEGNNNETTRREAVERAARRRGRQGRAYYTTTVNCTTYKFDPSCPTRSCAPPKPRWSR